MGWREDWVTGAVHGEREVGAGVGTVGVASGRSGGAEGRRADGLRGADVLSPKVGRALRFSLASGSPSPLLAARAGAGCARGDRARAPSP